MKWWVVALLSLAGFLNTEDRVIIFFILPLLKRDLSLKQCADRPADVGVFVGVRVRFPVRRLSR